MFRTSVRLLSGGGFQRPREVLLTTKHTCCGGGREPQPAAGAGTIDMTQPVPASPTPRSEVIDPVCGMTIDPADAAGSFEYRRHDLLLLQSQLPRALLGGPGGIPQARRRAPGGGAGAPGHGLHVPDGSRNPPGSPGRLPEVRHGARARPLDAARDPRRVHLPDASRDRAGRARRLPDLRDGARAPYRDARRAAQRGARRHDPPLPAGWAARAAGRSSSRWETWCSGRGWAGASTCASRTGSGWSSARRSCCGRAGRSSSAAGPRSSTATPTCSR